MATVDAASLRRQLAEAAPGLWEELTALAAGWTAPVLARLDRGKGLPTFPKAFNDPIWGTIELYPWEVVLLDSPLLQRLRGVRQLGMVHLVYHAAGHDRLEHSRGVVEAAERMIRALKRNAEHRRQFGADRDEHIPVPSTLDERAIRLAGLLHDIGHGPFSHALEPTVRERRPGQFGRAEGALLGAFAGATKVQTSETLAVLIVLSEPMRRVLEHPRLGASDTPAELAPAIAARMLGARPFLSAGYLSGVISGPLDADKLDYMARDSYHAGLPIATDLNRLINKLEVVTVTAQAPVRRLRERAGRSPHQRFHDMGISLAGLGAYEQLIVGRAILYDRMYYHHKVRAAEAMVRRLVRLAEEECGRPLTLREIYCGLSDDATIDVLSGRLSTPELPGGGPRAAALGAALRERRLYHRAYAIASRFIGGLDGLSEAEQARARALRWNTLLTLCDSADGRARLGRDVFETAAALLARVPDLGPAEAPLRPEHVLIDISFDKVSVRGSDILTRTEGGQLGTPNLFFNPEKWSTAYKEQKQCGFVFAPQEFVPAVALASRIVFYERFRLTMSAEADRAAKTTGLVTPALIQAAAAAGLCSLDCQAALTSPRPPRVPVVGRVFLPAGWEAESPQLAQGLAGALADCLPSGLLAEALDAVLQTLTDLAAFLTLLEESGALASKKEIDEGQDIRAPLRDFLRRRGASVAESPRAPGGPVDLLVRRRLVLELRKTGTTASPFAKGPDDGWQPRRYAAPFSSDVVFVVLAYRPAPGAAVPKVSERIRVARPGGGPDGCAQVRVVLPYGERAPHEEGPAR
jgi:HD superfamily phosphohydrolase